MALGMTIFAFAFTLATVNVAVHYLRDAERHKIQSSTVEAVIVGAVVLAAIGFFSGIRRSKPNSGTLTATLSKLAVQESQKSSDVLNLTLARIEAQSDDAKTLRFLLPRNQRISARLGQFLTFEWMIDGKPVTRSYSICSSATQRSFIEITPKRVENGHVSRFLNDCAKAGLIVKARGPYGRFYFDESKHERIVLVAGGSGITPMIAMLRYIDDFCLPVNATLIYCVRTEQDVFFKDELTVLQGRLSAFRYVLVLSRPGSDWKGRTGRLRREILEREVENSSESTYFL